MSDPQLYDEEINNDISENFDSDCHLELGDIIEIHAMDNKEYDKQTFFIVYIDDHKMKLTNIQSYEPSIVKFDKDGNIRDESIEEIILLSRSEEPGYARQHGLLPKTWIDVRIGGDVPLVITGEITNLEEDMIEITTYPSLEVIYIDFGYKGIPEHIPIEEIHIRSKPPSLEKLESLVNVKENVPDDEEFDINQAVLEEKGSMEYSPSGEAIITLPEDVQRDQTLRQELQTLYNSANEIAYGKDLGEFAREVEIPEEQKRYGIDTQVNDMLDVLLSEVPDRNRNDRLKNYIHLLIERFRELRQKFSKFDENGNLYDVKWNGFNHKPLAQHIQNMDLALKWILPVSEIKKKVYMNSENTLFDDITISKNTTSITNDENMQNDYLHNRMQGGDESVYLRYNQLMNSSFIPYERPNDYQSNLSPDVTITQPIESIIGNLENFYGTIVTNSNGALNYSRSQYVIQRYNLGNSYLEPTIAKTGRKVYIRKPINDNEKMSVKSILMLPKSMFHFSNVHLPGSSILTKSNLAQNYPYMFKFMHSRVGMDNHVINDFDKEMDKEIWENALTNGSFDKNIQHFVLTESLDQKPDRFHKYLNSIVPDTQNIIRMFEKFYPPSEFSEMLSVKKAVEKLEPFLVYLDDINYSQYNAIRYFMKEKRKDYFVKLSENKDKMALVRDKKYANSTPYPHKMEKILDEKKDLLSIITDLYNVRVNLSDSRNADLPYITSSEWLHKIYKGDSGILFNNMVRLLMLSLITPENLLDALESKQNEEEDMSKNEKIKASDCVRRVLTKKYDSLKDLQSDNSKEDVYYDKTYDDTPYDLLDKYKDEQKKYSKDEFKEFLEETLVQKHECPPKLAPEMAETIIDKKKLVREGEYALLELSPHLPENKDLSQFSEQEKKELLNEAEILKKVAYYKRKNNYWIHDETVDDEAFINTNELLCNMSKICFKDHNTKHCESLNMAEQRLKDLQKKKMLEEFDERFANSVEDMEDYLKDLVEKSVRHIKNLKKLDEVLLYKYDTIAFEMGKYAKKVKVSSPHLEELENILGQSDFPKKQQDIVRFAESYCRDPMVSELGDDMYYLYCVDTNTPLLPTSLFQLARAFVNNENYAHKLSEIVRLQGEIDGDSIYDKHTGRLLQKIDFVDETSYDEQGFKMVTNEVIEKDILEVTTTALEKRKRLQDRVFENEETEMVFKLYRTLCRHIGLQPDDIEEFVLRVSLELIGNTNNIKSERVYKLEAKALEKQNKRAPPYEIYRNKLIILIVTSVTLVAIQTVIPSFKIKKVYPGCVQSFKGFPENNGAIEDMSGLSYLACILTDIKKKSSKPWNAIKPLPMEVILQQMKQIISKMILTRDDIMDLYTKKSEYLLQHPELEIPTELSIQKWTHFLPPVVPYEIVKSLKGIPSDYKTELDEMQKTGNKLQRKQINMYKSKMTSFSYAIIENINEIIQKKGLLLKTASNVYFTENACCNDEKTATTLSYFEKDNKELMVYIRMITNWGSIVNQVKQRTIAPFIFDPKRSGLSYLSTIPNEHFERNVYRAFIHYCNLDNEFPIPEELRVLFPEKLADYDKKASFMDKTEFLKQNGKRFTNENLMQLMNIVNRRNEVQIDIPPQKGNSVSGMQELLDYFGELHCDDDDIPLCGKFRDLMSNVIKKYNPRVMVAEDSEELYRLNNWLTHANSNLLERITDFVGKNANVSRAKQNKLVEQLANIHIWNMDATYEYGKNISQKDETTMYSVIQFMKQSVFDMSKVYPEMLINNKDVNNKSHKNWNFAEPHNNDISNLILDYYKVFGPFKNDDTLNALLVSVEKSLVHLSTFLSLLPVYLPIHRPPEGDEPAKSFYSLFPKRSVYMIYSYIWYSTLYEYIKATDDDELLQLDMVNNKKMRRNMIAEERDNMVFSDSAETELNADQEDYGNELEEMQIISGNKEHLKKRVGELLYVYINLDTNNKKTIDLSYADIESKVMRSKLNEKKLITDYLKNMDDDERRVEDMKKMLKLGRWNVGLRKGLVNYDKDRYVEERNQLFEQLTNRADIENEGIVIQMDANQLQQAEEQEANNEGDQEAYDFTGYMGNDEDGAYYEEDREDEFNED